MWFPSDLISENKHFLRYLATLSTKDANKLIDIASQSNIDSVCEICYNVLHRKVKLTPQEVYLFRQNRNLIYDLVDKNIPWTEKKKLIQREQKGGIIPLVALLPFLGTLVAGAAGTTLGAVGKNLVDKAMQR